MWEAIYQENCFRCVHVQMNRKVIKCALHLLQERVKWWWPCCSLFVMSCRPDSDGRHMYMDSQDLEGKGEGEGVSRGACQKGLSGRAC